MITSIVAAIVNIILSLLGGAAIIIAVHGAITKESTRTIITFFLIGAALIFTVTLRTML